VLLVIILLDISFVYCCSCIFSLVLTMRLIGLILKFYSFIALVLTILRLVLYFEGPRGGAVRWGAALQAGRPRVRFPMVSLEFFIDIILPAALCPLD